MNRKEKRKMEKKLGLDKYKKSLPLNKRFELIASNIIEGKKKQESMKETVRLQSQQNEENLINSQISKRAVDLMLNSDMDYYSATEQARSEFSR